MMPSTSKKQHNFMAAVAHNPEFAKKAGVPQSVGKDFNAADKGKKFARGGMSDATVQSINKPKTNHGAEALFKRGGTMVTKKMAKGGDTIHHHLAAHHMKEAAKHMKMAGGGETMGPSGMGSDVEKGSNAKRSHGEHGIQKSGHTRAMEEKMPGGSTTGMRRGGKVK